MWACVHAPTRHRSECDGVEPRGLTHCCSVVGEFRAMPLTDTRTEEGLMSVSILEVVQLVRTLKRRNSTSLYFALYLCVSE